MPVFNANSTLFELGLEDWLRPAGLSARVAGPSGGMADDAGLLERVTTVDRLSAATISRAASPIIPPSTLPAKNASSRILLRSMRGKRLTERAASPGDGRVCDIPRLDSGTSRHMRGPR